MGDSGTAAPPSGVARGFLVGAQLVATVLFISAVRVASSAPWWSWAVSLILLLLIVINSIWFTRAVAWLIFAGAFFALLTVLSAFTLRWRLENDFSSAPFYRALGMYTAMVYASLAQIKMNSRSVSRNGPIDLGDRNGRIS